MSTSSEETRVVAGRYRLRSVLGSGSMGTVWSAYDEFLHRPVAVKEVLLPPGVPPGHADELRERTLREARAIAVLSHPNVIILHDVAREGGEPFVVMELLPSRSLAHLLRDHGPLSVEQAAAVGNAVAAALEAAHAAGITHRDVKPGNVLVAADGRIKLTDFGIARNVSEATMTRTGMMLGSPAYIAPEVASGGAVTTGADLWGLGATLFAAVEGNPPYDADGDPLETVGKVVNGDVPKPTPGPMADVITELMDKDPTARISLREVRQRLHRLQPKTPHDLFPSELFHTPDGKRTTAQLDATDTQIIKTVSPASPKPSALTSSQLAADPGPLPFMNAPTTPGQPPDAPTVFSPRPEPANRPATGKLVLALVAMLLFLAAAGGGFALARTVGGQSIMPPPRQTREAAQPAVPASLPKLVADGGDASNVNGITARFSIEVPETWAKFASQQPGRPGLPLSTLVQYVSPDGTQVVAVQRFADYFPGHISENEYLIALGAAFGPGNFIPFQPIPNGEHSLNVTYRTLENSATPRPRTNEGGGPSWRSTFANVFKRGNSLWVVSATVPVEQETSSRIDLFDRVAGTFKILE
ncbi:MAG: eukaryotic-like serine/threonine-protein kinase [Actinomycetota bacterium]|nr:eukaryotic-like serine/threonine-protein kinase [Actinomycetota bacterium]